MNTLRIKIFIFLLLLISIESWAQQDSFEHKFTDNLFISSTYSRGFIIAHRGVLSSLINEYTSTYMLEIGQSTFGNKAWHELYCYPTLGLGYLHTNLGNQEIFGHADAIYGFFDTPFFSKGKVNFSFKFGFGLAYVSKKFDLNDNIYNAAIGSNFNYLVQMAFDLHANLYKDKLYIKTGLGFNHMSNGKMQSPNLGLNLVDWHLTAGYYIGRQDSRIKTKLTKRKKHTFMTIMAGGVKEFTEPNLGKYFAGNITLEYLHTIMRKYSLGAGIDHFYDATAYKELIFDEDTKAALHANRLGIHGSYAINYNKIAFIVQMGTYIAPYYEGDGMIYHRIGFRIKLTTHIVANLTMKTHWGKADIVEFGLGYYFEK